LLHVSRQELKDRLDRLEAVDHSRSALRGEERSRNADIRTDVQHHVALADLHAVPDVGSLPDDLGELEQQLRRIVMVHQPTELLDAARCLASLGAHRLRALVRPTCRRRLFTRALMLRRGGEAPAPRRPRTRFRSAPRD
jgi:hypothetical protein